jgi:hypothetical protein
MAPNMLGAIMTAHDARYRSLNKLRNELARLMEQQLESLKSETFVGISKDQFREQDKRLNRIREVSADLLALLKEEPE